MGKNEMLTFFADYIKKEVGIVYAEHNFFQLENRMQQVVHLLKEQSLETLYEKCRSGVSRDVRNVLIDVATNNETSFFRDPKVFEAFRELILEDFAKKSGSEPLTIWSAACSTGQEPLSLVMAIKQYEEKMGMKVPFRILASDISDRALAAAQEGVYTKFEVQRGLPEEFRNSYFSAQEGERWKASNELMSCIEYKKINLIEPVEIPKGFDVVLCRNVLLYHSVDGKREILKSITESLKPGGILILGAGESLIGLSDSYHAVSSAGVVFYKKGESGGQARRQAS